MNSPETLSVSGISRRNMLRFLSLSVLVPSVSCAVDGITSQSSSSLSLEDNRGTNVNAPSVTKMKKIRPEEEYNNQQTQEEVSEAGKITLIVSLLMGLDREIRDNICSQMNSFFQEFLINPESDSYTNTARGSVKLLMYNTLINIALSFLSFKQGNASISESREYDNANGIKHSFLSDMYAASIVAPLREELIFRRFIPAFLTLFNSKPEFAQYYSSLIFGFVHNITFKGFDISTIPAQQILAGFFFFYLQQTRDITHSMTSHATYNGVITSLYHILSLKG